jgi:type II secretory pathway pseudopilin PulG
MACVDNRLATPACHAARCPPGSLRSAFTFLELIGTCLLLGVLFSITVPMLLIVARERRSTEQRQLALQHAANLLERATQRGWSDLPPGDLAVPAADADLQIVLPGLERSLKVKQLEGERESRQITATLRWQTRAGPMASPLTLSAWVYPTN